MQDFMDTVIDAFGFYDDRTDNPIPDLNTVAAKFAITAVKQRKLPITYGVYSIAPRW